jgi:hypothetical protein
MELDLQSLFGLHVHSCTHWLRHRNPPPPFPRIWTHIRGRYWSAKIDDISLRPPAAITRADNKAAQYCRPIEKERFSEPSNEKAANSPEISPTSQNKGHTSLVGGQYFAVAFLCKLLFINSAEI